MSLSKDYYNTLKGVNRPPPVHLQNPKCSPVAVIVHLECESNLVKSLLVIIDSLLKKINNHVKCVEFTPRTTKIYVSVDTLEL